MVIYTIEWILLGCITCLHDLVASFGSEFGVKLALLGPIELSVLFDNMHKRIPVCIAITKTHVDQLVRPKIYIGEFDSSNPDPALSSMKLNLYTHVGMNFLEVALTYS